MKKRHFLYSSVFLLLLGVSAVTSDAVAAQNPKYLVIVSDWGDSGPPGEIIDIVKNCPQLKLAIAWPAGLEPTEDIREIVKSGRAEPALALADEPIFPLIFETRISSPVSVEFSWPEDVMNIIARNQDAFSKTWGSASRGLYLRSGIFSEKLADSFKKSGICWVNYASPSGGSESIYSIGDFCVFVNKQEAFTDPGDFWRWVKSRPENIVVMFFNRKNKLPVEFLSYLASNLAESPDIEMLTPYEAQHEHPDMINYPWKPELEPNLERWQEKPVLWQRLSDARKAIDEYKNSGQANPKKLDTLKQELFQLYRYDLLARLGDIPKVEDEQVFQAGLFNVYKLLGRTVPQDINKPLDSSPVNLNQESFGLSCEQNVLRVVNSPSSSQGISVRRLTVVPDYKEVIFRVGLSSAVIPQTDYVDIYIDMNNRRGAGLAKILPQAEAFLRPDDAWEFAIRFKGDKAELYQSGRFTPKLLKTFSLRGRFEVAVPAELLRGTPLGWGYQVVYLTGRPQGTLFVSDYIASDDNARQRVLKKIPVQMPAVRLKKQQGTGY